MSIERIPEYILDRILFTSPPVIISFIGIHILQDFVEYFQFQVL